MARSSFAGNFTSLTRDSASFDAISANAVAGGLCTTATADPAVMIPPTACCAALPALHALHRQSQWAAQLHRPDRPGVDPFASVRADIATAWINRYKPNWQRFFFFFEGIFFLLL